MKKEFLKPVTRMVAGEKTLVRIVDPDTGEVLPEGGAVREVNQFYARRKEDGDAVEAKPKKGTE